MFNFYYRFFFLLLSLLRFTLSLSKPSVFFLRTGVQKSKIFSCAFTKIEDFCSLLSKNLWFFEAPLVHAHKCPAMHALALALALASKVRKVRKVLQKTKGFLKRCVRCFKKPKVF
jgi:hypothetical protein